MHESLLAAQRKAKELFRQIETQHIIAPHRMESEINRDIHQLAADLFGVERHWHKRIVRAGRNTLAPYAQDPPDLRVEEDDVVFLDFGPVLEQWEADFGRTYVLGSIRTSIGSVRMWKKALPMAKNSSRTTPKYPQRICSTM